MLFIRIFSEEDFIMVPVSSGTGDCTETAYEGDLQRELLPLKTSRHLRICRWKGYYRKSVV